MTVSLQHCHRAQVCYICRYLFAKVSKIIVGDTRKISSRKRGVSFLSTDQIYFIYRPKLDIFFFFHLPYFVYQLLMH